jgi:nucleotide-binding universal stress UspA family protein
MTAPSTMSLLVALDGSERSLKTVAYLCKVEAFRKADIRLFYVLSGVPETYWDLVKEPSSLKPSAEILAWASQERDRAARHLGRCREILLEAGAAPDRVETILHERRLGVSRDILSEARKGYDALVIRRRGMSTLVGLTMGSVAQKLLHNLDAVPIVLAGSRAHNGRVLIAYDGSEAAERAVDFVGRVAGGTDTTVALVHVLRSGPMFAMDAGAEELMAAWAAEAAAAIRQRLEQACRRLEAAGLKEKAVSAHVVQNAASRAGAVVEMAARDDFGTIVVGRRGLSRVQEFTLGRVGNKIVHLGREHTVWVVN